MTTRRWKAPCALAGVIVLGWAAFAAGQTGPPANVKIERRPAYAIASVEGRDSFAAYCASCHGVDARGNGPAARALKMPPADLTAIGRRHGTFDPIAVEFTIVGKTKLAAHGGEPEMPVWGPVFRTMQNENDPVVRLRLANLVKYLESIQQ